jgi:hypothetical protein
MNQNPLSQYFRQPAVYIRLPSKGKFYPKTAIDVPESGELPVLPMTTMDEITYRTPDALFNGQAVATVIQSCLPNIKDAWQIPSMDLDTILVAIRIASFGHNLDVDTVCPACENENTYSVDLGKVLTNMAPQNYDVPLKFNDLEIYLRPMSYKELNINNMAQFEEQKAMQILSDGELTDETRNQQLTEVLKSITAITIKALATSIAAVKTPSSMVTDPEFIQEWMANSDRALFNKIRDEIIKIKQASEIQPLDIACTECSNKYHQPFTLNMTNFFGPAS